MPKNKYDKVDAAVDEGLLKMKAEQWRKESEKVAKVQNAPENLRSARERLAEVAEKRSRERRLKAAGMQFEVDRLFLKDRHLYTALGTHHEEFTQLIQKADTLNDEEWKRLMEIKEKLDAYKKSKEKKPINNEVIVELERKKHINKRHNVKDGWLPLH